MKVWRLTDEDGTEIASVPVDQLIDYDIASRGCRGFGIYEALDTSGHIIYTGRTSNLRLRLRAHSTSSAWWGFAAEIRWTPVEDYAESVALERVGISTDRGDWNIAGHLELPSSGRQSLPTAMRARLVALYGAADGMGRSADLNDYIRTARSSGWTLQSIADALSITREGVRQRAIKGAVDHDLFIPSPGQPTLKSKPAKVWPTIPAAVGSEMRELQEKACLVRGLTPLDHPNRVASERLTELIVEAKMRGVRDREIAETIGVATITVIARMKRHGYRKNSPSQPDYMPGSGMAVRNWRGAKCSRGHDFDDANTRFINGDPTRRICRKCERIRCDAYRARLGKGRGRPTHPIRAWAQANDIPIGPRGPIPAAVRAAYEAAHRFDTAA